MTVGKRGRRDFEYDTYVSAVPDRQQRDQDAGSSSSSKRACGTGLHPAPGVLSPQEVATFMSQLTRSFCVGDVTPALAGTSLDAPVWQAFAELHLLMEAHWRHMRSADLLGYHSLVRTERAGLWRRYALAHGWPAEALHMRPGAGSPTHLQLVAFLLEVVLGSYPEASLIKYTLRLPHWAAGWAARWGWSNPSITVLLLQAHPAGNCPLPARTLYVPMLP
jgi:hypothetical protein